MSWSGPVPSVVDAAAGARNDTQEDTMQWIAIGTPPFTDIATFDAVCATFDGEPDGLEARWVGRVGDEHA
jgi:hypothetical protein